MRQVELDPTPADRLDSLHARLPRVAAAIEEILDWIEADPVDVRARRRFSNGIWVVVRTIVNEWILLWEEDPATVSRWCDSSANPHRCEAPRTHVGSGSGGITHGGGRCCRVSWETPVALSFRK